MRLLFFLTLFFAAVLAAGPAYGHGENAHQGASTEASLDKTGNTSVALPATEENDEASGSYGGASEGHNDPEAIGFVPFLRKLHPATVHFPIALFLTAAFVELAAAMGMVDRTGLAVRLLITAGAIGAIAAALFGWIHTGLWFGGEATMQLHRWMGSLIAVFGVGLAILAHRKEGGSMLLRTGLFSLAVLVVIQGYFGGELAHGPNHLGLSIT